MNNSSANFQNFEFSDEFAKYQNTIPAKGCLCFKTPISWEDMPDRRIITNLPDPQLPHNHIETSKYNILTFFPKNLKEQFTKLNNVYFLIIGALEMINEISTSGGIPVIWLPLIVIVLITALKDLLEDLQRHRSDRAENERKILKLTPQGNFIEVHWEDLRVGDLIKVLQEEYFPADMILLRSSEKTCVAYIETKSLDGETNLKMKSVPKELGFLQGLELADLRKLRARAEFERPNPYLYNFVGSIEGNKKQMIPLDQNNFILRGCSLKNTAWVYGLVCYTGHDTKIMLNSIKARPKQSKLEKMMQQQILYIFILQLLVCVFSAFYSAIWYVVHKDELSYLDIDQNGYKDNNFAYNFFVRLGNWLMILTNFVPISLLVTLEMVKFLQGIFLANDPKMMSMPEKTAVKVQTSTLNEELGQVQYIFSDKTGTLTCNVMEFKKISINGISYGDDRSLLDSELKGKPKVTNVDFRDRAFFEELENKQSNNHHAIKMTLLHLSLCHTTICEISEDQGKLLYNASSPDELALVNYARFCGYEFQGKDEENFIRIKNPKQEIRKFELLHVLEFNSTRKRMSVIVKDLSTNEIILLTKGADSIIQSRLSPNKNPFTDQTFSNLETYATNGLRTLLLAKKLLSSEEYDEWAKRYAEASTAIQDREAKVMVLQDEIETGLELVAATAIEDKLQDQVGLTIKSLKKAGIKLWVLTGDKLETAINIGYSCKLLSDDQEKIIIDGRTLEEVNKNLLEGLKLVNQNGNQYSEDGFCLIITGDALIHAIKEPTSLVTLAERCATVIACRVSPKQKQEIVSMVKQSKPTATTLAIGDGANDVNMITAAHVGIGIRGVEGQQAARASDYAIGEFKVLRRLLLNHGREYYRRNSNLICYNFFKNMILVLPQFWFAFYDGFSGVSFYDQYLFQLFNLFYTSLPIFVYSLMDKEYSGTYLTRNPHLYTQGIKGLLFRKRVFWTWMFMGTWQSLILTYFIMLSLENINLYQDLPFESHLLILGMVVYGATILNTNIKIILFSNIYTPISMFFIWGSILFFVSNYAIESKFITNADLYDTFNLVYGNGYFYLINFLIIGVTSVLDSAFTKLMDFMQLQKTGEKKVTVDVKGELSEEEREAIRDMERSIKKLEQQNKLESLEIIAPPGVNRDLAEENKENEEDFIGKRSLNAFRNSLLTRKYTGFAFSQAEPLDEHFRKTYQN